MMPRDSQLDELPPYRVRTSSRARHVRLTISDAQGLVVVVPRGFDQRLVPTIVRQRKSWIDKHLDRLGRTSPDARTGGDELPRQIDLTAVGLAWPVHYRGTERSTVAVRELAGPQLHLVGAVDDPQLARQALRHWLARQARNHLLTWLEQLSLELSLPYDKGIVRGQRTRWGSCSSRKTISLNYQLLFLPPRLVRYVLLHELCHTRELNHSRRYWRRLAALAPDYRELHRELQEAGRHVPAWVNDDRAGRPAP